MLAYKGLLMNPDVMAATHNIVAYTLPDEKTMGVDDDGDYGSCCVSCHEGSWISRFGGVRHSEIWWNKVGSDSVLKLCMTWPNAYAHTQKDYIIWSPIFVEEKSYVSTMLHLRGCHRFQSNHHRGNMIQLMEQAKRAHPVHLLTIPYVYGDEQDWLTR